MISEEAFKIAAKCASKVYISDNELDISIQVVRLILNYFEIRGEYFRLIKTQLRDELTKLKGYKFEREKYYENLQNNS